MANGLTPDDERAQELDKHFEAHVIRDNTSDGDLYVAAHGEDAEAVAEQVDGIEFTGNVGPFGGFHYDYADE